MPADEDMPKNIPDMAEWRPTPGEEFYTYENGIVRARYDKLLGLDATTDLMKFRIEYPHFMKRMPDIIHHINYFLTFFDEGRTSYLAVLSVKYFVDINHKMSASNFQECVLERIITPKFIADCKRMARYLYNININTDPDGKFKNSPKISNDQGRVILALSFCFRIILPLCIHFTNIGECFRVYDPRTGKAKSIGYLEHFAKLFRKIFAKFEEGDTPVWTTLCKFVVHRAKADAQNNKTIFQQKEMLRGDTLELYIDQIIQDVVLVKNLYKLDYRRSPVSFLDGIVKAYGRNYTIENYSSKPTEIDSADTSRDSDDHPSHAESIEMATYKIDESNPMINDVNTYKVLEKMRPLFKVLGVSPDTEEFAFYNENLSFNEVSDSLFHSFYSKRFEDPYAIYSLSRADRVLLQLYMKKFFQQRGMPLMAQMCTAKVRGYYKENTVKNARFQESIQNHPTYIGILSDKFKYLKELDAKEDPILRKMSGFMNCTFECVDMDPEINGKTIDDIDIEQIKTEFLLFLTII